MAKIELSNSEIEEIMNALAMNYIKIVNLKEIWLIYLEWIDRYLLFNIFLLLLNVIQNKLFVFILIKKGTM